MNGLYLQQLRLTHREVVLAKAFQLLQAFLFKNRCEILFLTPLKGTAEWQLKCLLNTISVNWLVLIKTTHDYCTVQLSCAHTWVKPFRCPILRCVSTHRQIFRTDVNHEPWSQLFHSVLCLIEPKVVLFLIVSIHEQWDCVCSPHVPPGMKVESTHIMLRNRSLSSYLNR